jgi:hypothetical protein
MIAATGLLIFVLSASLSNDVPQSTTPDTKCSPCQIEANESYWDKMLKPDVLPVWIGGGAAFLASIVGLGVLWVNSGQTRIAQQTLALQFRPKLSIRTMKFDISKALSNTNSVAEWRAVVANIGTSTANVASTVITFDSCVDDSGTETIYPLGVEDVAAFNLEAGEIKTLSSLLTNARDHIAVGIHFSDTAGGQYVWVRCTGVFVYTDRAGIKRRQGFRRRFDMKKREFVPDPDPEYEFDDET